MEVKLRMNEKAHGAFYIMEGEQRLGEMVIGIAGDTLTAYHTEVFPEGEGRGLAKMLLDAMVDYARQHRLKVKPLCLYVHAQFKKHPEAYGDVWQQGEA
ncbi:GNAT family N-acetyltransferase [Chitinophaga japonensis]|uniref:N-acetyltransferase domain-containing protein n=1 Tax=Chitinophaga japonensis TaxID=104662 RepID=A0A562T5C7_CHIJA|nr:GNAT family N-acetyltransferase [Chitinophaga japonensis]TWI88747.1 hypothetical protein LX66_2833 [Chitinophaga japonensis]